MDFSVARGRPALHERRSDRLVPLEGCPLLRPELADLLATLENLRGTRKIVLRSGVNTGDVLALIEGRVPDAVRDWDASVVVRQHGALQTVRGRAWFEEEIDGVRLRVPAEAFFQINPAGAETLVRLVAEAAAVGSDDVVLDGYAGVGLFAATVGRSAKRVITIDSGTAAFRAVERNLESSLPGRYLAMLGAFEETAPGIDDRWDVAIVDPPRAGLGSSGVAAATRSGPRTVVLISCDPASLARDAGLLETAGYTLDWVQPVDLFPQTYHVETVTRFVRR
jgi:23S rRNA (uracil1939-C5)-methyltransferase